MLRMQVIGNLGGDARTNDVGGKSVVNFSVAHGEKWKDKNGEKQERTIWIDCSLWEKPALAPFLKSGDKVWVEGTPYVEIYRNKQGVDVAGLRLRVDRVEFCQLKDNSNTGGSDSSQQQGGGAATGADPNALPM